MRRTATLILFGLMIGLLVATALPSTAANGDTMRVGTKNTARNITKLIAKNGLLIEVRGAGRPAITLNTNGGAPIRTNSTVYVENLNADLLDGRHSYQLRAGWDSKSNDSIADAQVWSTDLVIHMPAGGGAVAMSGGVGFHNSTGGAHTAGCRFKVDGVDVSGSFRAVTMANGESASCNSEVLTTMAAGNHTITFTTFATATTGFQLIEGSWYVMVLPN